MTRLADCAGADGWMSRGACHDQDPELFFPVGESRAAQQQIRAAKTVCGRCEVRSLCLTYALGTEHEGIWGGTTGLERAAARRRAEVWPRLRQHG